MKWSALRALSHLCKVYQSWQLGLKQVHLDAGPAELNAWCSRCSMHRVVVFITRIVVIMK